MRQIKFRAWHKEEKKMYEIEKIYPYRNIDTKGGEVFLVSNTSIPSYYFPEEVALLQYTGLKDSKRTKKYPDGQEIYEGDIVRWHTSAEMPSDEVEERVDEVKYVGAWAAFYPLTYNARWRCDVICEVIGNVYEHSHLLDTKTEK